MSVANFKKDCHYEADQSSRAISIAASHTASKAMLMDPNGGNSRVAFLYTAEFEREGWRLVEALAERYEAAAKMPSASKPELRRCYRDAVARYVAHCGTLGRTPHAFKDNRNALLDRELAEIERRLDQGINYAIRGTEMVPKKGWHERHPVVYATALVAAGAVLKFAFDVLKVQYFPG